MGPHGAGQATQGCTQEKISTRLFEERDNSLCLDKRSYLLFYVGHAKARLFLRFETETEIVVGNEMKREANESETFLKSFISL